MSTKEDLLRRQKEVKDLLKLVKEKIYETETSYLEDIIHWVYNLQCYLAVTAITTSQLVSRI